ncbi:tetratricopeptide repeat protein [Mangrovimonas cancribranchiae]|uniref:Tetratricopeptide repeat protein n=1 Tax=Mangrovimonas cancribranchiae TaxID=3080055 RepID=A0AAU6P5P3_9FLAO
MRNLFTLFFTLLITLSFAQDEDLANEYFKNGEFEKAIISYQKLLETSPNNYKYLFALVESHQNLEQFQEAEKLLTTQISRTKYPALHVELGYNFQLQNNLLKANENYDVALTFVDNNPRYAFIVGRAFEDKSLLDYAITAYKKAMELNPELKFDIQLARIYGEKGEIEKMFNSYLNFLSNNLNKSYLSNTKRIFSDFISENPENEHNILLKNILLKKSQKDPNLLWNEMLSWLFVQQKEYNKAFMQEKAIFARNPVSLSRIIELGDNAKEDKLYNTSIKIFTYITKTAQDTETILEAENKRINLETQLANKENYKSIQEKYTNLFDTYGKFTTTLDLQISYANFLAFNLNQTSLAISNLRETLKLPLSKFQEAKVKLTLGDILVYEEKFNEALIYYSQIQRNLKNSTLSQEARFKVAQTSYYKGDFKWAESQLKILKSSTTQLIANDALDLMLLITDNKYEDSTQTALKLYAKADLMAYQNKNDKAITLLNSILEEHKGKSIEDQALLKQAQLFEEKKQYDKAIANYQNIIANYNDDILADDAYFSLAELYNNILAEPEKAKPFYEKIIFNHEDSIYYVEARKKYRMLRGDTIN